MDKHALNRIKILEKRMRVPSSNRNGSLSSNNNNNEQSFKSIKSNESQPSVGELPATFYEPIKTDGIGRFHLSSQRNIISEELQFSQHQEQVQCQFKNEEDGNQSFNDVSSQPDDQQYSSSSNYNNGSACCSVKNEPNQEQRHSEPSSGNKQLKSSSSDAAGLSEEKWLSQISSSKGKTESLTNTNITPFNQKISEGTPKTQIQQLKLDNLLLREKLKIKDQYLVRYKEKILQSAIDLHKLQRNELKAKITANKHRLGQFCFDKKGKEGWVDGLQLKKVKSSLQSIMRDKQDLQKIKKNTKRATKEGENIEEWKNYTSCYSYYLNREEATLRETLQGLEEQKIMFVRQYKIMLQEENSRYFRQDTVTGEISWPQIGRYQLVGLLGKGGFCEVYKAIDGEELKQVAVKLHYFNPAWSVQSKETYIVHAIRQNSVHRTLNHPNIVKLYDTVQIDKNSFCTVLQYCQGPDLSIYLKRYKKIPEKEAKTIIRQIICAVNYLHNRPEKVIHYDLKPQNILFHKGRIRITDFGLCKTLKQEYIKLTSQGVGTYWYLPPQCFQTETKSPNITVKVDVWSIGVIYYEMIYGQKPFGHQMSQMNVLNENIIRKATQVIFPPALRNKISPESKQFIQDCLRFKVQDRLDTRSLLNHKLFQKS